MIIEDDSVLAETIGHVLNGTRGFQCVGVHYKAETALKRLKAQGPDVVYLDLQLPKMNGLHCLKALRDQIPDLRILVVTVAKDPKTIFAALEAGASGYLLKPIDVVPLLGALRSVHQGGGQLTPSIAHMVIQSFRKKGDQKEKFENLTNREKEVLIQLSQGLSNKEIACELKISVGTVNNHVQHIYEKLHVNCRAAATSVWLAPDGSDP